MRKAKTYQLACLRDFLTEKMALNIYVTTILPYFDYADILYMNANLGYISKLQVDQNRCLKICLRLDRMTNTELVHHKAQLPMLTSRRYIHLINFMYKRSRDNNYVDNRLIGTRAHNGPLVRVTRSHCASFERSIGYQGALCWNSLPPNRRNAEDIFIFKSQSKIALRALIPLN